MSVSNKKFSAALPLWAEEATPAALKEMMRLALAIRDLMEDEEEDGRVAIACAALNRMRRYGPEGEGGGGAPSGPAAHARDFSDPALCRAIAVACLVLSGDLEDPTGGATHFHRHTEEPGWARTATPKALIGQYMFYTLDQRFDA